MATTRNTGISIGEVEISEFIFHVVHHGSQQPILMDSIPLGSFETFFKERIIEIISGNKFLFLEDSMFLGLIKNIEEGQKSFLDVSKELATIFHQQNQDERIKPGVMILINAEIAGESKYILIKYDHENVITYTQEGNVAVLKEITNTFSKDKSALQKSAVIDINDPQPFALVIDKSDAKNVTKFFKGFLGIARKYDDKILTGKVKNAYIETVKHFKAELPKEIIGQTSFDYYSYVQSMDSFDTQSFLPAILGVNFKPEMVKIFERELKKMDILGEEFSFDKSIRKPARKKFFTLEGIKIEYSTEVEDKVSVTYGDEETTITITTAQLIEDKC